mmetsp:Transcript_38089/g.119577  ORF Transcript_38089/g.119577 Transcript_38089/m.119577 type:complete len:218 (+) Transcript_38089:360-1013(+)
MVPLVLGAHRRLQAVRRGVLHGQPRLKLSPEAGHIRQVEEDQDGGAEVKPVHLLEHPLEGGRVLRAARALGVVLRHASRVNPDALNLLAVGRVEEALERLELLPVRVRVVRLHPAVRDRQGRLNVGPLHHVGVVERHFDERLFSGVVVANLLEKRQALARECAHKSSVQHEEGAGISTMEARLKASLHRTRLLWLGLTCVFSGSPAAEGRIPCRRQP